MPVRVKVEANIADNGNLEIKLDIQRDWALTAGEESGLKKLCQAMSALFGSTLTGPMAMDLPEALRQEER